MISSAAPAELRFTAERPGGRGPCPGFEDVIAHSPRMRGVVELCQRIAPTSARVLLLGETGTGKDLLARAIHRSSGRKPFVAVNCAAVPPALIEAELFGHERGAFTGATERKPGLFLQANGGTLLLDELGDLPLPAQASLLRVLQEGCVRPLGGGREAPVDVRVIAATSSPLDEAVEAGRFRQDLLYRLDVIRVAVPPLRARQEDIVPLFDHHARELAARHGLTPLAADPCFQRALRDHRWPGNVRQLLNLTERLLLTHQGTVRAADFQALVGATRVPALEPEGELDPGRGLAWHVDQAERRYLEATLRLVEGSLPRAAELAAVSLRTLHRKLRKHGLGRCSQ